MVLKGKHFWIDSIERIERLDPEEATDLYCEDWNEWKVSGHLLDFITGWEDEAVTNLEQANEERKRLGQSVMQSLPRPKYFLKMYKTNGRIQFICTNGPLYILSNEGKTVDKLT